MRWLFLFVLLINIAYIAWQVSAPEETEEVAVSSIGNAKPIVLLGERELLPEVKNVGQGSDSSAPEQVAEEKNMGGEDEVKLAEIESPIESPEMEKVEEDSCYTVGPFHELETLRTFVKEIKTYVTNAEFRNQDEKKLTVYWVYINPEKSRRDARKLGKRLKSNKIKDFYIIRTGEKNNGISLGHFNSKYRATKLTKKVKKLGFDVEIEPVFKTYTVYWLDYQTASDKTIPQSIFDKYIKSVKKDKISLLTRECAVN
jgi:cell division septation protein DedD